MKRKKLLYFVFLFTIVLFGCGTGNAKENIDNSLSKGNAQEKNIDIEVPTDNQEVSDFKDDRDISSLSEEELKAKCIEVTYEDMFDGENALIQNGTLVSFYGMVKEKRVSDMMHEVSISIFDGLYEYDDKYLVTGPKHTELDGFVGHDVNVYFLKDDGFENYKEIEPGTKITVYGQVIVSADRQYVVLGKYIGIESE